MTDNEINKLCAEEMGEECYPEPHLSCACRKGTRGCPVPHPHKYAKVLETELENEPLNGEKMKTESPARLVTLSVTISTIWALLVYFLTPYRIGHWQWFISLLLGIVVCTTVVVILEKGVRKWILLKS